MIFIEETEPEFKTDSGWHYHAPDFLELRERGVTAPMVKTVNDFIDNQIFFLSKERDTWTPFHIKGGTCGYIQLFTFKYKKKLEVVDWLEYHGLFDYKSNFDYTLSKKGKKLVDKEGYDVIQFVGDELEEFFIVNPKEQVTDILSIPLKGNKSNEKNPREVASET